MINRYLLAMVTAIIVFVLIWKFYFNDIEHMYIWNDNKMEWYPYMGQSSYYTDRLEKMAYMDSSISAINSNPLPLPLKIHTNYDYYPKFTINIPENGLRKRLPLSFIY